MKIKTFGKLTEIINQEPTLDFPIFLAQLKENLETQFPDLKTINYCIAINDEVQTEETFLIQEPISIALMPPFSGG